MKLLFLLRLWLSPYMKFGVVHDSRSILPGWNIALNPAKSSGLSRNSALDGMSTGKGPMRPIRAAFKIAYICIYANICLYTILMFRGLRRTNDARHAQGWPRNGRATGLIPPSCETLRHSNDRAASWGRKREPALVRPGRGSVGSRTDGRSRHEGNVRIIGEFGASCDYRPSALNTLRNGWWEVSGMSQHSRLD